jgi:hypothetical protein
LHTATVAWVAARLRSVKGRATAIWSPIETGATVKRRAIGLPRRLALRPVAAIIAKVWTETRSTKLAIGASTPITAAIPPRWLRRLRLSLWLWLSLRLGCRRTGNGYLPGRLAFRTPPLRATLVADHRRALRTSAFALALTFAAMRPIGTLLRHRRRRDQRRGRHDCGEQRLAHQNILLFVQTPCPVVEPYMVQCR